jgi:hypothetical protein
MMSATPIFEQLCREILDATNSWPGGGAQPAIVSQPKGPAHALETSSGRGYGRGAHLPPALAGWACPTG